MQLSWHFKLDDLTRSETAARRGIDNTPPAQIVEKLKYLCEQGLEPVYQMGGAFIVTSGYRCPELNAAIGSKPTSAHCKGLAADIQRPGVSAYEFAKEIINRSLNFDQVIHEFGAWVHLAMPEPGSIGRKQVLTIDHQGVRTGLHEARPKVAKKTG